MKITKYINPNHLPNVSKPNWKKVFRYAKLMEQGVEFPPVNIYRDNNGTLCYNDGRNRVTAAKMSGKLLKVKING